MNNNNKNKHEITTNKVFSLQGPQARGKLIFTKPVPGFQIAQCGRIKTSKAKIRRTRLGKGGGGGEKNGNAALSLPSPRAFFAFLFTERLFTTIPEPGTG